MKQSKSKYDAPVLKEAKNKLTVPNIVMRGSTVSLDASFLIYCDNHALSNISFALFLLFQLISNPMDKNSAISFAS